MTELFRIKNQNVYEQLNNLLSERLRENFVISRNENGKPYIEGNPLYFSLSHSGNGALIGISEFPIGVDMEYVKGKNYQSVLSRFSDEEKKEIKTNADFFRHWTAREAYIKMLGASLAEKLKDLSFERGTLYDKGISVKAELNVFGKDDFVYAICEDKRLQSRSVSGIINL